MRCQESDRGAVLLNEIRAKGLGSSSWNDDAERTQKAVRRGKAPCCVAEPTTRNGRVHDGSADKFALRKTLRWHRGYPGDVDWHWRILEAEMAPTQESGLRENCTSRLSERAEAGPKLHLSRLYTVEAG